MTKAELLDLIRKSDHTKRFSSLIDITIQSKVIPREQLSDTLDVNIASIERWAKGKNLPLDFARPIMMGQIINLLEAD